MKKILIISYFFPPCSKSGVHRILRMAEYLPQFGWEPIFLAVKDGYWGSADRIDERLNEIVRPFKTYKSYYFFPFKKGGNSLFKRLVRRIWSEVMIPDSYVMWVPFAVKKGIEIIKNHRPNAIFVTGTPFSSFLIGYFLKKKTGLPLFLDYRDPWTNNPGLIHPEWKIPFCKFIENKTVKEAALSFAATPYMAKYISKGKETDFAFKFKDFTYSYSKKSLNIFDNSSKQNTKFTITFAGAGSSNPVPFFTGLKILISNHSSLLEKIEFNAFGTLIGLANKIAIVELIQKYKLNKIVKVYEFINFREILQKLQKSHLLLLPYNVCEVTKVTYPGKMFDYFAIRRPILYLGPKGQAWETIEKTKTGVCVDPENPEEIAEAIFDLYQKYYVRKEPFTPDENELKKFESEYVIGKFVKDIEEVLKS